MSKVNLIIDGIENEHILKDAFVDIIKNNGINEQKYFESFKKDGFARILF